MSDDEKNDKLKSKVGKLIYSRWETNKDIMSTLNAVYESNKELIHLSSFKIESVLDNISYENFLTKLDKTSNDWKELAEISDRNTEYLSKICKIFHVKNTSEYPISDSLDDLCSNRKQLEDECLSLEIFSKEFQLVEGDYFIINSSKLYPINEYLRIVRRIKLIMSSWERLNTSPYNCLSENLMTQMQKLIEICFDKISENIRNTFITSQKPHLIISDGSISDAINLIKDHPVFFQQSLLGYVSNRRSFISYQFHRKLKTSPQYIQDVIRPSIDPSLSIESLMDYLLELLAEESSNLNEIFTKLFKDKQDLLIKDLIGNIFEILSRVLREYFDKIFSLKPPITSIWLIILLLTNYIPTIQEYLNISCSIIHSIIEIRSNSIQIYSSYVVIYGKKISSQSIPPPSTLEPSALFKEATILVETLTSMRSTSLLKNEEINKLKTQLVSTVVNALLQSCHLSASQLDLRSMAIYLVNSFHNLLKIYDYFETSTNNREYITSQLNAHIDTLVTEQSCYVFSTLKITKIYHICQSIIIDPHINFMDVCDMEVSELILILNEFKNYCQKKDPLYLPQLNLLMDSSYKKNILERYQRVIEDAYADITSVLIHIPKLASIFAQN